MSKETNNINQLEDIEVSSVTILDGGMMLLLFSDGTTALVSVLSINDKGVLADAIESTEDDEEDDEDEEEEDDDEDDDDEDDDDEDDDEDDDDEDDDDEEEYSWEDIKDADFEELEDIIDDANLEVDADDYDEKKKKEVTKLRKAIAKELGIKAK